jgi:hypothetical protein
MIFNFGGDPEARRGMAGALEAFITHMTGAAVTVTPHTRVEDVDLRWYVGLDPHGTAIGDAMWRGKPLPATLIGVFRLDFADPSAVRADLAGQPVWLLLGLGPDGAVRMKPQNLLAGLPLAEPDLH